MRFLVRTLALGAVALSAFALSRGYAEPSARWQLEARLPADTLAMISIEDVGGMGARMERTALMRMVQDPEMQAFLEPLMAGLEQLATEDGPLGQMPPPLRMLLEKLAGLRGQVAIGLVSVDMERKFPNLVASLDFGDNVDDFMTFLTEMKAEADPQGEHIQVVERDGRSWWQVQLPDGPPLLATAYGSAFVIGTDPATVESVIRGDTPTSLAAEGGAYRAVRTQAGGSDLAIFAYLNVPSLVAMLEQGPLGPREKRMADALGLDTVKAAAYGMSFQGDGFRDALIVHAPDADHGILTLMESPPFEPRFLSHVPANAFYYEEGRANIDGLLARVRTLVKDIEPRAIEEMDQGLGWLGDQLGVDLENDVLAQLSGHMGSYMSFPETGGLFPEFVYFLGAKDPDAFEAVMDRLVQGIAGILTEEGQAIATTRSLPYHGTTLHVLELQGDRRREMIPFTPTWARVGDAFAIALVPHTLKEVILRHEGGGPAHGGLAAQEDFKEILAARPRAAGGVSYFDLQGVMTMLYDTGAPLAQMLGKPNMLPREMPPLDFALLPATRTMRPYLRSLGIYTTWNKDGLSIALQGPIPMAAVIGVFVGGMAFGMRAMAPGPGFDRGDFGAEVPDEAGMRGMEQIQHDMAEIQARDLSRSVRLYVMQNDRMPDTLEDLVGSDVIKVLPSDPWGSPFRLVVVDAEARRFQLVSAGADGRLGTPDDVVVDG
jgi:hypothetical protein